MRGLPVALLALLAVVAADGAATPPAPPWQAEGRLTADPLVGRSVELVLSLRVNRDLTDEIRVQVPPWVAVEPPEPRSLRGQQGQRFDLVWRLTATQAGYWSASVRGEGGGWCCVHARSGAGEGRWTGNVEQRGELIPAEVDAVAWLGCRVLDEGRVEFEYVILPQGPWTHDLRVWGGLNFQGAEQAESSGGARVVWRHVEPMGRVHEVTHVLSGSATVLAGPLEPTGPVAQRRLPHAYHGYAIHRENDTVFQRNGQPCPPPSEEPPPSAFVFEAVPGQRLPGIAGFAEGTAAAALAAVAVARRRPRTKAASGD